MPEDYDFTPAPWATHDSFRSARAVYDAHAGRSYDDAVKTDVVASDLVPDHLKSDSPTPIVILCDVTGSMGDWPATIFEKLPYLDHEAKELYFGEDYEICFGAIGDCFSDRYPLQIRKFATGEDLTKRLKELVVEGNGGASSQESYDLGALYFARNCDTPHATHPLLIFIGDEGLYDKLYKDKAKKCCKVDLKEDMTLKQVFDELMAKWDVYLIRKPYGHSNSNPDNSKIEAQWEEILGKDHIAQLPEAKRVVDVIFGIFAKVSGKVKEFNKELRDRQLKDLDGEDKVNMVLKSLMTIHRDPARLEKGKSKKALPDHVSVTRRKKGEDGKTSKSLL